ncbi:MAG: hypothetical protein HXY43_18295 [Fischerella sp.]|jgi:hypothetical protein|uniref:hypothetical protein n=1 Tax=unclassified Fischerella TaxID=494603 RepID=UPI00047DC59B|nr:MULTISPECIES: hypothetical protein [unclassified Fischerella]NWF61147.1 hypothetical protein [Fischerella sp.]
MSVGPKYSVIFPISLGITLLLAGCNNSKVSQCQQLIGVVNEGNSLLETNKVTQVSTSLKLAQDLEAVTKKIEELNLEDPKLQDFQTRFVKVFITLSQNINKAGKALGAAKTAKATTVGRERMQKARDEIDAALKAAEIAGKQSDVLAAQINKYCSQPE